MNWIKANEKLIGGILILVLLVFLIFKFYKESSDNNLLKKSIVTPGFISQIYNGASRNPKYCLFIYSINGKKYESSQTGDYTDFQIGDTLLIEYAVENHSVARVVDKYYMQKYKYLKEKQESIHKVK